MSRDPLFITIATCLAVAACTPQGETSPVPTSSASSVVAPEPVYVLRVEPRPDAAANLARFEGHYDVVDGCLAFVIGGEPHLPALTTQGDAYREGDKVTIGTQTIELGKTITPGGGVLDAYYFERAASPPPAACADWPKIRI